MKVTVSERRRGRSREEELLELSCRTELSRINANHELTKALIQEICAYQALPYTLEIGVIAAHVAHHYNPLVKQIVSLDIKAANRLFSNPFKSFQDLVRFGTKCVYQNLPEHLQIQIRSNESHKKRLSQAVSRLLRSLFLQFVPLEYSQILLGLYLQQREQQNQKEWMERNREKNYEFYPYHDLLQLLSGLALHIGSRNSVGCGHFLEILEKPVMGRVEWPIIIGSRSHFQLYR